MIADLQANPTNTPLTIRIHLADGSVHSFTQNDAAVNKRLWDSLEPARLFAHSRIVVGSEHSKSVFVADEIIRVDFVHDLFQCWEFAPGYSDIVEISEEDFRKHARLDEPELRVKRDRPAVPGDLVVSFVQLRLRGGSPLFAMVEVMAKLPAESQSFMQHMLAKASMHMRLQGGGLGVVNLANLVGYTVYPGLAQIPGDSWLAEPVLKGHPETLLSR